MWRQIHQILPFLTVGDAVGTLALEMRRLLQEWGYTSEIFAENWDPRLAKECRSYKHYRHFSHPDNLLILHYATGGQVNRFVLSVPDRVIIYYHNITPEHFFYWVNGALAQELKEARRDLDKLAGSVSAICDSPYNQRELEEKGIRVLGIVPPILSFSHLDRGLDHDNVQVGIRPESQDTINWLHVGRLAPNKCIQDIIKAFYYYHKWITPESRLFLVGSGHGAQPYVDDLQRLVARLGLVEAVIFTGLVEQVAKFYHMAHVYISMSEHEGFCIPLVEAMYCGLPVIAYASTGIPFTMGDAGALIRRKEYPLVAEVVHEIVTNALLRSRLVEGQRARLAVFAPDATYVKLRACLDSIAR